MCVLHGGWRVSSIILRSFSRARSLSLVGLSRDHKPTRPNQHHRSFFYPKQREPGFAVFSFSSEVFFLIHLSNIFPCLTCNPSGLSLSLSLSLSLYVCVCVTVVVTAVVICISPNPANSTSLFLTAVCDRP
jgi:hypothetical protein